MIAVEIKVLAHGKDLPLPHYQTDESAGMDLYAAHEGVVSLAPGARMLIPTGLSIALPSGYEAQVRPRSGLALKQGVTVLNSPGTIDADYRGEVGVILINHGEAAVEIRRGDRIAQLLFAPVVRGQWQVVEDLGQTARGAGGFGSTGVQAEGKR